MAEASDTTLSHPVFKDVPEWSAVPQIRREEVVQYLEKGILPRGFIYELLCNNFMGAMVSCPDEEVADLPRWAVLIKEHVPLAAHGNRVQVESYARHRRDVGNDGTQ